MESFIKFNDSIKHNRKWRLNIYHSSVLDWKIAIENGLGHLKEGEQIIYMQDCDIELVFVKVQVVLDMSEKDYGETGCKPVSLA